MSSNKSSKNKLIELWKDIENYEGLYQVSNTGKIRSLDRIVKDTTRNRFQHLKGKVLKETDNGKGYKLVFLNKGRKRENKYVHRLVAEAFIPNPTNLEEVNHKDLNKSNNCVSNLEWISNIENKRHYQRTDIAKQRNILKAKDRNKKFEKRIQEYASIIINGYTQEDLIIEELRRKTKLGYSTIVRILKENNIKINPKKRKKVIIRRDEKGRFAKKETVI